MDLTDYNSQEESKMITYDKVNQIVLIYNKKFFACLISVIVLFLLSLTIFYITYTYGDKIINPEPEMGSQEVKIEYFRNSYRKFKKMSEETFHMIWRRLFKNCTYEKNGNYQQRKIDCSGAVYIMFKELRSNIPSENVEAMEKRIRKIAYQYPETIRYTLKSIKPKDIVIIKFNGGARHIGVVYAIRKGIIQYIDFNIQTGEAQKEIWWKNKKITTIAQVSFPLWLGDLLYEEKNVL